MEKDNLEHLSEDQLWTLRLKVSEVLEQRIRREKLLLESRLRELGVADTQRRHYPPVLPKYQNPERPSETWTGRGRHPRWLVVQLKSGRRLDEFRIRPQVANAG